MFSNKKFMYWMTEMTGHTVIFFPDGEGLGIKTSSNTKYLFSYIYLHCTRQMVPDIDAFSKRLYIYELNKMVDHLI